ncbi:inorganic phosphate transporter [Desulfonatronovibrio hydrogenovorans]|uniref:inorganic phosphate transporter n=1 Tax=Desulfonatronovibrio hydrogenovorans TaxID=53245 RepID=UPI00048A547E|nr:inorganic phosphate transporter [Desulfonatronovibrio hydrogenovorans]
MEFFDLFLYLSMAAGFLMAFSLGANDVANSMAPAVGARAITVRQAVIIAGSLTFVGAVFLGANVTATITRGIINPEYIADPKIMLLGMFSALLAASLWVLVASITSLPVSSTHSIVGSILGFALVAGGPNVINWWILSGVVLSWFISPLFAGGIAYFIFSHIRKYIFFKPHYLQQARIWAPRWIALTAMIVGYSFLYKTPLGKQLEFSRSAAMLTTTVIAFLVWMAARYFTNKLTRKMEQNVEEVEGIFRRLQIMTASYVALSHGANDVANAIGPVAAIYLIARQQALIDTAEIPLFMLVLGGIGLSLGIMVLGHKVMSTVGNKITTLTHTRGFAVNFSTATTVLVASNMGMPVSTTHACVGGVTGVGLARGFSAVNFKVLLKIVGYWVLTVPIAALTSIVIFQVLMWTFIH